MLKKKGPKTNMKNEDDSVRGNTYPLDSQKECVPHCQQPPQRTTSTIVRVAYMRHKIAFRGFL